MLYRKSKSFIYILLCCFVLFPSASTAKASTLSNDNTLRNDEEWPKAPSVTAESAIVMDASTGLVLYDKNSQEAKYPASITKIMTTLVAIENSSLSDTVTFSNDAVFGVDLDSSRVGIDVGETLSMQDCLYAIMLASANEVSYAVAEKVAGSMEKFVEMMNQRATELGCINTNFSNPHGLQDENHYTCSYDMALIARAAIQNTSFAKITGTRTYVIPPTNLQEESRPLANHHKFIKGDLNYPGVIGGKTGYTSSAKYTLVTYAQRGDLELICVVMGSDSVTTEYSDTAALLDYGFNNFSIYKISNDDHEILSDESPFFTKYSKIFSGESPFLTTGEDGYVVLPNNIDLDQADINVVYHDINELQPGDNIIGEITYTYQDKIVGQTDIIYKNEATSSLPTKVNSYIENANKNPTVHISNTTKTNKLIKVILWVIGIIGGISLLYYIFVYYPRLKRKRAYYKRRQARRKRYSDYDYYE